MINNCTDSVLNTNQIDQRRRLHRGTIDVGGWDSDVDVTNGDDCDDTDDTIYLGAFERCDGQDNDTSTPSMRPTYS